MATKPTNLTAQQRASLFTQSTRQNLQMLPQQTTANGATTLQFTLPKTRLLSKIMFDVECSVNLKHATETTITNDVFAPFMLLRRVSLDLNNGFQPFVIGGRELGIYNMMRINPNVVIPQATDSNGMNYFPPMVVSSGGTNNTFKFTCELPITLNDRDAIGLILLQNDSTNVTLTVDIANAGDIFDNQSGYTVALNSVKINPCIETFSLPAMNEAFPDLSVIKLVNSRTDKFAGGGQNIIKLNTGTVYRKLLFYIMDENGDSVDDTFITSNIELVFNQADINYSIRAENLRHLNQSQFGYPLPKGVFAFDFAYQGIPNLGGTRDYIDTEKLTEFWLRFNTSNGGKISVISECLARLK